MTQLAETASTLRERRPRRHDRVIDKMLLTPEEAAASLSVSRSRVYELIATGALESVRIGVSRRIPADALADYVAELRQAARDPVAAPVVPRD